MSTTNQQKAELPIVPKQSKTQHLDEMNSREALKSLRKAGCEEIRQTGSHVQVKCPNGKQTTIPAHSGKDIKKGTFHAIEKSLNMDIDGDGRPVTTEELEQQPVTEEALYTEYDKPVSLDEVNLTWAGKLFFASIAAYVASDIAQAMKLPIKLRGKPEEIKAVVDAITSSKDFQREIKKPGAKIEDVVQKMNLRNMNKSSFERLTGKKWPL